MAGEAPPPPTRSAGKPLRPLNRRDDERYLATPRAVYNPEMRSGYVSTHRATTPSAMEIDTPARRRSVYVVQQNRTRADALAQKRSMRTDMYFRVQNRGQTPALEEHQNADETPKLLEVVIERLGGLRVRTISAKVAAMPQFATHLDWYYKSPQHQAKIMKRRKVKETKKAEGKEVGEDVEMEDPDA